MSNTCMVPQGIPILTDYIQGFCAMDNDSFVDNSTIRYPTEENHSLLPFSGSLFFGLCALFAHAMLLGITIAISRKCFELNLEKTAEHAFYCTLAFVFLAGEALLVRYNQFLAYAFSHETVNLLHTALGLLAFFVGFLGVGVKTWQKRQRKLEDEKAVVKHFRTKHGFFGMLGCVFLLLTVISGLGLYFFHNKTLHLCHRSFGISAFVMLMISQVFSYNTGFARRSWKLKHIKLFKFFTVIATLLTVNYAFRILMRDFAALIPQQIYGYINVQTSSSYYTFNSNNTHD